jgi:hypothetical protein
LVAEMHGTYQTMKQVEYFQHCQISSTMFVGYFVKRVFRCTSDVQREDFILSQSDTASAKLDFVPGQIHCI